MSRNKERKANIFFGVIVLLILGLATAYIHHLEQTEYREGTVIGLEVMEATCADFTESEYRAMVGRAVSTVIIATNDSPTKRKAAIQAMIGYECNGNTIKDISVETY